MYIYIGLILTKAIFKTNIAQCKLLPLTGNASIYKELTYLYGMNIREHQRSSAISPQKEELRMEKLSLISNIQ